MKSLEKAELKKQIKDRIASAEKVIDSTLSATEQSDALNRIAVSNLYNALVNLEAIQTEN